MATDQIVPASTAYQAQMRLWLAARASGIVAYLLLTAQVVFGLILSHPTNQTTWKLSKRLFPWHENLWVFVLAFLGVHIVSLILDPYAGVGVAGSFIPGLSSYRSCTGRPRHPRAVRPDRDRPDRSLHAGSCRRGSGSSSTGSASACSSWPGSTASWPGPTRRPCASFYIATGLASCSRRPIATG